MARKQSLERPSPLALNYVERSGFRRRALCVLTLLALAEVRSANAACVPAGTSHGDTIVCSGSQTEAVTARSGDDSISILPNASIILGTQQSTTAVDAGSGNDSVVNDGLVSLTLALPAVAPAGKSSSCSANRDVQGVGIAGGGGYDLINNRGAIAVQTAGGGRPVSLRQRARRRPWSSTAQACGGQHRNRRGQRQRPDQQQRFRDRQRVLGFEQSASDCKGHRRRQRR